MTEVTVNNSVILQRIWCHHNLFIPNIWKYVEFICENPPTGHKLEPRGACGVEKMKRKKRPLSFWTQQEVDFCRPPSSSSSSPCTKIPLKQTWNPCLSRYTTAGRFLIDPSFTHRRRLCERRMTRQDGRGAKSEGRHDQEQVTKKSWTWNMSSRSAVAPSAGPKWPLPVKKTRWGVGPLFGQHLHCCYRQQLPTPAGQWWRRILDFELLKWKFQWRFKKKKKDVSRINAGMTEEERWRWRQKKPSGRTATTSTDEGM